MVEKIKLVNIGLLLILALGLSSCSRPMHKNKFVIAGTYLEVTSPDSRAAEIVHQEFKRLSNIFNRYDPNSELSRLNKTYNLPFSVSGDLIEILALSRHITILTEGAFDVSQGVLYSFWKSLIDEGQIVTFPDQELIAKLKNSAGMEAIEIDFVKRTVSIKQKGLVVDLGGIAKGFMVDKAVSRLKQQGINSALINAGGDMYCLGKNRGKPWRIGIKDPEKLDSLLETKQLTNQAITTSGSYEQFFRFKDQDYSHLIDPSSGYPVNNSIVSVSVIAEEAVLADALATAFFVIGIDGIEKFLVKNPKTAKILVVVKGGSIFIYE